MDEWLIGGRYGHVQTGGVGGRFGPEFGKPVPLGLGSAAPTTLRGLWAVRDLAVRRLRPAITSRARLLLLPLWPSLG